MNREVHVRFCGNAGVKLPCVTRLPAITTITLTLQDLINDLPKESQNEIAIRLTKLALPIWNNYADQQNLTYRDTVVGLMHLIDKELLSKTIDTIELCLYDRVSDQRLRELRQQFLDPIAALQDGDWSLPYEVEATFYSVYNLLDAILGNVRNYRGELTIYVSINQAADALEISKTLTFSEISDVLNAVVNGR